MRRPTRRTRPGRARTSASAGSRRRAARPGAARRTPRPPRRRLVDHDGPADARQRLAVRRRAHQRRAVAELGVEVAHPREHHVQLLAVVAPPAEGRARLDEHDLPIGVLTPVDVAAELIGEDPQRGSAHRTSLPRRPGRRTAGTGAAVASGAGAEPIDTRGADLARHRPRHRAGPVGVPARSPRAATCCSSRGSSTGTTSTPRRSRRPSTSPSTSARSSLPWSTSAAIW